MTSPLPPAPGEGDLIARADVERLTAQAERWLTDPVSDDETTQLVRDFLALVKAQEQEKKAEELAHMGIEEHLRAKVTALEADNAELRYHLHRPLSEPALQGHFRLFSDVCRLLTEHGKSSHAAGIAAAEDAMQMLWREREAAEAAREALEQAHTRLKEDTVTLPREILDRIMGALESDDPGPRRLAFEAVQEYFEPPDHPALRCMDCKALYSEFPLDTTLPDEQWRRIHGSEGGVLCASCIVRRAGKLPGVVAVRAVIEFAPRIVEAWEGDFGDPEGAKSCGLISSTKDLTP